MDEKSKPEFDINEAIKNKSQAPHAAPEIPKAQQKFEAAKAPVESPKLTYRSKSNPTGAVIPDVLRDIKTQLQSYQSNHDLKCAEHDGVIEHLNRALALLNTREQYCANHNIKSIHEV